MKTNNTHYVFPIIRREYAPDPYAGEQCCYEPGICMRLNCGLPRWNKTVLCKDHAREVYEKKAKAPPLVPTFISSLSESMLYPTGQVFFVDLVAGKKDK